ncbi:MAG TPA: symmetrical bis(5'-nucleosyl)-tetraphosphatase [Thiolapillus brandeum]|uniref:Bis(5'-nucleosyl)-tetraphosphatase, symmetrical n=1 Tax=Thiolapillus brandeum TaxID=1076588 RepID=A0A831RW13_9GAMM|nr:symmetrical bis(5'-nucleosyl)-tetraphosphatase [Thiolapillus brandeum]
MAVYAIGDIQGCYDELQALLDSLQFDPASDRLWFVGDLVNRGPRSLDTLRFVSSLGDRAITVLGNHDLHLLALASGNKRFKDSDDLNQVLDAPDRDELIHWLRHRPLMHHNKQLNFTMIHAGLPPQWDLTTAQACAREVEAVLRGPDYQDFFDRMYGNKPNRWDPERTGMDRLRFITNCFTRLRFVTKKGKLKLKLKGSPLGQKKKYIPWFAHPRRLTRNDRILFGHWSTLGYQHTQNTWALDTGCLWGGELTALRIDRSPPAPKQYQCEGQQDPTLFV